jgi:2-iminobutanoate/2-iminopropanoate deaminase
MAAPRSPAILEIGEVAVLETSQSRQFFPVNSELLEAIDARSAWSDAVSVGPFVFAAGQIGWDKRTGKMAEGIEAQAAQALENIKDVLERAGATMADVVSLRSYLVDEDDYHRYEPIYQRYFPQNPPARVSIVVARNIHGALVDFEVVAVKRTTDAQT